MLISLLLALPVPAIPILAPGAMPERAESESQLLRVASLIPVEDDSGEDLGAQSHLQVKLTGMDFDVDYVVTWYNSRDPVSTARYKERMSKSFSSEVAPDALNRNRFTDAGELRYNLRALDKYAPWIRKVMLVVGDDIDLPTWINPSTPKLQVVRHSEIFPNKADLPTFNSHAIESRLAYIPGLSERFLYANDDMFINNYVGKETFFTPDGKPRVREGGTGAMVGKGSHDFAVRNSLKLVGSTKIWPRGSDLFHQIKPFSKTSLQRAHDRYAHAFDSTASHPFRSRSDVWALLVGSVVCVEEQACQMERVKPSSLFIILPGRGISREFQNVDTQRPTLFCVNDSDASNAVEFENLLSRHFPDKSQFEK